MFFVRFFVRKYNVDKIQTVFQILNFIFGNWWQSFVLYEECWPFDVKLKWRRFPVIGFEKCLGMKFQPDIMSRLCEWWDHVSVTAMIFGFTDGYSYISCTCNFRCNVIWYFTVSGVPNVTVVFRSPAKIQKGYCYDF